VNAIGNRIAPPRFLLFLAMLPVGFFGYRALPGADTLADSAAMAFDFAALVFFVSLAPLVRYHDAATMRAHAAENDANREFVLGLTILLTVAVMAAIAGEMTGARLGEHGAAAKLIGTLLLVWLFTNSVFTLHYAHAYYEHDETTDNDVAGLNFPDTTTPTYGDFAYFAFTLGMTFQTSDVEIASPGMRRIVLLHSFGAFLFNIGVIAFAINVLGG